jgi:DNA-directed RNA polymerase specialized sigma24 family protein
MVRLRGRETLVDTEVAFSATGLRATVARALGAAGGTRWLIWWAVNQLPENCRVLLHPLAVVGPTYAEVAEILGMAIGWIGPTRGRCLKRLREILAGRGIMDGEG